LSGFSDVNVYDYANDDTKLLCQKFMNT
jgi:hypothetical protein